MGVRKGISVTPNVCSFVVQACGQAESQVLTRKYRLPTRFRPQYPRSSLCSVVVLTHDFRRLEAHSVRLGRRLNKLEDDRHVNFSNILPWYSSTPMAMTLLRTTGGLEEYH